MSLAKKNESARSLLFSVAVLGLAALGLWFGASFNNTSARTSDNTAPAATFNGTGVGPIPDLASGCQPSQGAPLNVTFNVTGQSGSPTNVALSTTFGGPNHSWSGDITATLIAPSGQSHSVFGRVVATTGTGAGDSSDLGGTYTFADSNTSPPSGGFWQAAVAEATGSAPIAPGAYRTTGSGGTGATNPMPATNMNAAFASATANGTWTLRLTDGCAADTGAISAAILTVDSAPVITTKPNVDFDGDGKSDFSIARDSTPTLSDNNEFFRAGSVREKLRIQAERPNKEVSNELGSGSTITWYNRSSLNGSDQIVNFGTAATDFVVPNDYDGDGKADIAVWRPGAATVAAFYILQSSNSTLRTDVFGQTGDDPAITGDYDGDQKADVATYRCPAFGAGDGQCFFYYRGSNANPGGNITFVPWGFGESGDYFVNPGDFDGDGKHDFCVQRANPSAPTSGQFVLRRSSDGGVEFINWGNSSDFIIPGDYDGDGKADFCVRRTVSDNRQHWVLQRTGSSFFVQWGITGDVSTPGDYDGDGKTDFAIWRPNPDPDQNFFYVLRSSNLSLLQFEYGIADDIATANWLVH
jgi:hypothetical protein